MPWQGKLRQSGEAPCAIRREKHNPDERWGLASVLRKPAAPTSRKNILMTTDFVDAICQDRVCPHATHGREFLPIHFFLPPPELPTVSLRGIFHGPPRTSALLPHPGLGCAYSREQCARNISTSCNRPPNFIYLIESNGFGRFSPSRSCQFLTTSGKPSSPRSCTIRLAKRWTS